MADTGLPTTILLTERKRQYEALVYLCEFNDMILKEIEVAGYKVVTMNDNGVKIVLQRAKQMVLVVKIFEIQNHFEFLLNHHLRPVQQRVSRRPLRVPPATRDQQGGCHG